MDLDDLKSGWKNANTDSIDEQGLIMMTKVNQHPTLKKLRLRMTIEAVLLTVLLFVYYDGFDGGQKPFFVNVSLVTAIACYIINNALGYFFISNPVQADDILASIQKQVKILKRLSVSSLIFSIIYAVALLAFFSSSIEFTSKKYVLLGMLIIVASVLFFISFKNWTTKIRHFEGLLEEMTN